MKIMSQTQREDLVGPRVRSFKLLGIVVDNSETFSRLVGVPGVVGVGWYR